jgi:hypothetical protein
MDRLKKQTGQAGKRERVQENEAGRQDRVAGRDRQTRQGGGTGRQDMVVGQADDRVAGQAEEKV